MGDLAELRHVREIFDALRGGRHLCPDDGEPFQALSECRGDYERQFKALGFELRFHHRGFFYFNGRDAPAERSKRLVVFMFILIEAAADEGLGPEEVLHREFSVADLPHLQRDRYRAIMTELGVRDADGVEKVVSSLVTFGFAIELPGKRYRFRAPAYRFLDICLEVLNEPSKPTESTEGA